MILEREGGGERERNINMKDKHLYWLPSGDQTHHPGMCPDQGFNPQPFGVWDGPRMNELNYLARADLFHF